MATGKPAHKATVTRTKGKTLVTCVCGWSSKREADDTVALSQYIEHTGNVEKRQLARKE